MDEIYAWDQPVVDHIIFNCVDYNCDKVIIEVNSEW